MRRGLGRGRSLIAIGAVLVILSMPLPWLRVGGVVLSAETANGFDGPGALLFVVCLVMLAVIVLPYTLKNRRAAIDRVATYVTCSGARQRPAWAVPSPRWWARKARRSRPRPLPACGSPWPAWRC